MSRRVSRGLSLTDKGRAAIGVAGPTVDVPLLTDDGLRAIFSLPRRVGGFLADAPGAAGSLTSWGCCGTTSVELQCSDARKPNRSIRHA